MSDLRHFIIFRRTEGHCATWLVRAVTLREAILKYALEQGAGADLKEDGTLTVDNGYGGKTLYPHPLAYIEDQGKTIYSPTESLVSAKLALASPKMSQLSGLQTVSAS